MLDRELAVGQAAERIGGGAVGDEELLAEIGDVVAELADMVERRRARAAASSVHAAA